MATVFDPISSAAALADVASTARASSEAICQRQRDRIAQALASARAGSALYRERLAGLPDHADALVQMAPVGRDELMGRFEDWVTDPDVRLDALRDFASDVERIGDPYLGKYLVWESSGTSGSPGIFLQDAQAMSVYDALEALRRAPASGIQHWLDPLHLTERIAFVGATGGHFASFVTVERLRRLQPWLANSMQSFSILQPVEALVASLNAFAPSVIATYPTVAALLAEEAAGGRLRLNLNELWTGGETLSDATRQRVESVLDCKVRNNYGASEFLSMGWECSHGKLHLNTDWCLLEPVDELFQPVPAGETSCSVLLSNLANKVQPLIRYDLGDQVTLDPEPCACGSGLPVFDVQGRRDDTLCVAGRHGHEVQLLPLALSTVLEEEAGVFDFQIQALDRRSLVLRLPLGGAAGREAMVKARAALKRYAQSQGALPIHVKGEVGQAIPRGRSGKACRILRCKE